MPFYSLQPGSNYGSAYGSCAGKFPQSILHFQKVTNRLPETNFSALDDRQPKQAVRKI